MKGYIGLDIGTSAVKGVFLTEDGSVALEAKKTFAYIRENKAYLLDPVCFTETVFDVIKELADGNEVYALCFCHASGNPVFLDKDGRPMSRIIGWQSEIDEDEFESFWTEEEKERVYRTVGWPAIPSFPVSYFPWIKKHREYLIKDSAYIMMSGEYLLFRLCGKTAISPSAGTPFYLIDGETEKYSPWLLEKYGIDEKKLPLIVPKGTVLGTPLPEMCERTSLGRDTKIVIGSFDHPSGATGAGVFDEGDGLLSCGTSWVAFFPMNDRDRAIETGMLVDRFMLSGTKYCVMGSVESLGAKIDAAREKLLGRISHEEFSSLIDASRGETPVFDFDGTDEEKARGFAKAEIAKGIIKSASLLLKKELDLAEEKGIKINSLSFIGGITNSPSCVRVVLETTGKKIKAANGQNAGAVGAAMLAAIGTGRFRDEKEAYRKLLR